MGVGVGLGFLVLGSGIAHATHFRYGHITWVPKGSPGSRTVDFTIQGVWRRDAYGNASTPALNRCVSATNSPAYVPCTGSDGFAAVGDIIHETQAAGGAGMGPTGTTFNFGDGSSSFGVTIGGTKALLYLVTSIDPTNNWLFGLALDHTSLPTINTTIEHTYGGMATTIPAKIEDCCRISACVPPNAHLNNPDNGYRVTTTVDLTAYSDGSDSSPVSGVPPIILCPEDGPCNFQVPVSDNEEDPVTYRLATLSEMHADIFGSPGTQAGLGEPGQGMPCADATIDPMTGAYSWDPSACRLAGDPGPVPPQGGCGDSSLHSFYSTQVIIEESARHATSAVDFLIELVPACDLNTHTPQFQGSAPACDSTISANPGQAVSFTISATDGDATDLDTLNAVGLPGDAVMTPGLPEDGNPVSSAFSWTPMLGDLGQHVLTFTAEDSCKHQALCTITIDVSQENCTDGIDNDGDTLIDCADPDCNGTSCDDGHFCTVDDKCSAGACTGTMRDCTDTNACTTDTCDDAGGRCVNDPAPHEGASCDDDNACTNGDKCVAGVCAGAPIDCSDGNVCTVDTCDPLTGVCAHSDGPAAGCFSPAHSLLLVRKGASTAKNKVVWKWLKGPTDSASLGDPAAGTTEYSLCVYDQSSGGTVSHLAMHSTVEPGSPWVRLGSGAKFRYKDRNSTGQLRIKLKSASGKGRIGFKSKGDRMIPPDPAGQTLFTDDDAILVQLVNSAGKCWQSRFASPGIKHTVSSFKDKCGAGGQPACN
jgi:hypothetical protein